MGHILFILLIAHFGEISLDEGEIMRKTKVKKYDASGLEYRRIGTRSKVRPVNIPKILPYGCIKNKEREK